MATLTRTEVDVFGVTDIGKSRQVNQDQFLIASMHKTMDVLQSSLADQLESQLTSPSKAYLLVVADGVGGASSGGQASETALRGVADYVTKTMDCYYSFDSEKEDDFLHELKSSVLACHESILEQSKQHPEQRGMATTLTLVKVLYPRAYIIQVGDSRCYLCRGQQLTQVTRDQTVAQGLVDQGILTESVAEESRWSNVLSSALGANATPVITKLDLWEDDALLLSTDGLTKHVSNEELRGRLVQGGRSREICRDLVDLALERGGTDNITVIVGKRG